MSRIIRVETYRPMRTKEWPKPSGIGKITPIPQSRLFVAHGYSASRAGQQMSRQAARLARASGCKLAHIPNQDCRIYTSNLPIATATATIT